MAKGIRPGAFRGNFPRGLPKKGETKMDEARKNELIKSMRIETIRSYWWYPEGALEAKTMLDVKEIYENLLDWLTE